MKKRVKEERVSEFRIKYNAGEYHSVLNNYHYYMAYDAQSALDFHNDTLNRKHTDAQNLSVERYNIYSQKWEDESEIIKQKHFYHSDEN